MTARQDRIKAQLNELTLKVQEGERARLAARPLVREALRAGVPAADLIGRPFSRALVYTIQQEMRDRGELPGED